MKKQIATIVSRLFEPFVAITVLFILEFYNTPIFIPAFLMMIALPFILFLIVWKLKFVSNWDVSDRKERPKLLWTLLIIEIINSIVLRTTVIMPLLLAIFGFALISHFWKISGHTMANAFFTGMIIKMFGWVWWPTLFIVPVVAWSRVVTKNHTVAQVIAGALYSWMLLVVFAYWSI